MQAGSDQNDDFNYGKEFIREEIISAISNRDTEQFISGLEQWLEAKFEKDPAFMHCAIQSDYDYAIRALRLAGWGNLSAEEMIQDIHSLVTRKRGLSVNSNDSTETIAAAASVSTYSESQVRRSQHQEQDAIIGFELEENMIVQWLRSAIKLDNKAHFVHFLNEWNSRVVPASIANYIGPLVITVQVDHIDRREFKNIEMVRGSNLVAKIIAELENCGSEVNLKNYFTSLDVNSADNFSQFSYLLKSSLLKSRHSGLLEGCTADPVYLGATKKGYKKYPG